jgi:hypothetical protein
LLAAAAALAPSAPAVAAMFARSRLQIGRGAHYGTAALTDEDADSLLARALPA